MNSIWDCEESGHIFTEQSDKCLFCDATHEEVTEEDYEISECDKEWLYDF